MVESWKVSQFIKKYEECLRLCNNWLSFCSVCIQHIKILWKRFVKSWISAGISVHVYFWGIVSSPLQLAEVCSVSALIVVCIIDSNALHLNQLCWLFVCLLQYAVRQGCRSQNVHGGVLRDAFPATRYQLGTSYTTLDWCGGWCNCSNNS